MYGALFVTSEAARSWPFPGSFQPDFAAADVPRRQDKCWYAAEHISWLSDLAHVISTEETFPKARTTEPVG